MREVKTAAKPRLRRPANDRSIFDRNAFSDQADPSPGVRLIAAIGSTSNTAKIHDEKHLRQPRASHSGKA